MRQKTITFSGFDKELDTLSLNGYKSISKRGITQPLSQTSTKMPCTSPLYRDPGMQVSFRWLENCGRDLRQVFINRPIVSLMTPVYTPPPKPPISLVRCITMKIVCTYLSDIRECKTLISCWSTSWVRVQHLT